MHRAFERSEDAFAEMANDICQHIQTTAMRHAQRNVFDAEFTGAFDQSINQRHDRLATFERESLLTEILSIQKTLKLLSGNKFPKNSFLDLAINRFGLNELTPNLLPQPKLFVLTLNVPILDADFTAVSALQDVQNLAEGSSFRSRQPASNEQTIEVPNREIVSLDI